MARNPLVAVSLVLAVAWPLAAGGAEPRSASMALVRVAPRGVDGTRVSREVPAFAAGKRPWYPFGCNYFDPHVGWAPQLWKKFDRSKVEAHFDVLKSLGVNVVRVFLTAQSFFPDASRLEPEALDRFDALLETARRHGIRVHPTGPDHWEGTPAWRRGDLFADAGIRKAQVRFWDLFSERYRGEPAIFAYDLLNEPHVGWGGKAMETAWRAWLEDRYGSMEALARSWGREASGLKTLDGIGIPLDAPDAGSARLRDFQRFREFLAERWVREQVGAIRSKDPDRLVTVGLIQWSVPVLVGKPSRYAAFRPARIARHLDFLSIHFYPLYGDPLAGSEPLRRNLAYLEFCLRYVHAADPGKPLVVGEFGWYGGGKPDHLPAYSARDQVRWCRPAVLQGRGLASGWLNWAYADTPSSRDISRYSGLVTAGGKVKPWGEAFRDLARDPAAWLSPRPSGRAGVTFHWREAVVNPAAGDEALRRYAAAWEAKSSCRLDVVSGRSNGR